ncbi:MAG: hypothetical protein HDR06_07990 [Lachnospiraceae bacterium]|nr:hypothetical protein [Lachnospiraceae bacterium]
MVSLKDGRLMRELVKRDDEKGYHISIDNVLDENVRKGFGGEDYHLLEDKRRVIYIHTMIQDYKKFSYDIRCKLEHQKATMFYINSETDIISLWGKRGFLYFSKKAGFLKNAFLDIVLQVIGVLSLLSSIFAFILPFKYDGKNFALYPYFLSIVFIAIGCLILFFAKSQREKQVDSTYNLVKETEISDFSNYLSKLKMGKLRFSEQNILIIENINKLEKHVQAFLIYYLMRPTNGNQIWCILDDGADKLLITKKHIKGYIEEYYLCPVSLEDKKELIYQLRLSDYKEELLGTLGIDTLFWEELGYVEEYEYSGDIVKNIKTLISTDKYGKNYIGAVYCIAYLMVKLGYIISLNNIVQLVCYEHDNKRYFRKLEEQCKKDIGAQIFQKKEFEEFLRKLIDVMDNYCIVNNNKGIRFSTNFLKCLETHFEAILPSRNTIQKWVLVKLICNQDKFNEENYFLDCCNLLQQVEFEDIATEVQVSLRLLNALNRNCCWLYYPVILNRLDSLTKNTKERVEYIQSDAVKTAVINYRILIADDRSAEFHKNYLEEYCSINQLQYVESIPMSRLAFIDYDLENNLTFYQNMMRMNDPTAYYYYLMAEWMKIHTNRIPESTTNAIIDLSWDYPVSEPVTIIFALLKRLIVFSCGQKGELMLSLQRELNGIIELLHSKKYYSSQIIEKIVYEFNNYFYLNRSDYDIRILFLGTAIENTNSTILRFLFNMLKISVKEMDSYKFQSVELNYVYSFIYYKINPFEKGISDYICYVIDSDFAIAERVGILLCLLTRGVPKWDNIIQFCVDHKGELIQEICSSLDYAKDMESLGNILVHIYILEQFFSKNNLCEEITNLVIEVLTERFDLEGQSIIKIFRYVMLNEDDENTLSDLSEDNFISIVNDLSSRELAITFFAKYYRNNEHIILALPKVAGLLTTRFYTTISMGLIGDYLLMCPVDKVEKQMLQYYIRDMRKNDYDKVEIITTYLEIIDKYDGIMQVKKYEKKQYSYYQAKLIKIELSALRENVMNTFTERQLLDFTVKIIQILAPQIPMATNHKEVPIIFSERSEEVDNYVLEHIKETKAVIMSDASYLNKPYVDMIFYLFQYPESYAMLVEHMGQKQVELILNSSLIQLLGTYIEIIDYEEMPAAISYLQEARTILKNYNHILREM